MANKDYNVDLYTFFYDQRDPYTWDGVALEADVDPFLESGCALCALAAYKNMSIRGVYAAGACTSTSPLVKNWLGTAKKTSTNYLEHITNRVVNQKASTIVHVTGSGGHYVTVSGFMGRLPLDSNGKPICADATADMILINDSWGGRCQTIEDLLNHYGDIDFVRQ